MHSHGAPAPEDTPGRTAHSDTYDTPKEKKYAKQGTRGGRLLLMLLRPVSPGRREAGKGNRGRLQYWGDVFVHCDIVVGRAEGSRSESQKGKGNKVVLLWRQTRIIIERSYGSVKTDVCPWDKNLVIYAFSSGHRLFS